jgi:Domain of unknown function (DUF4402)
MKRVCGFILALAALPSMASAQCQLCAPGSGTTSKLPAKPLQIEIDAALDLGRAAHLGQMTSGTVSIDPVTGARRVTGGLADLGGMSLKGTVRLTGDPFAPVAVSLPNRITLSATNGSTADVVDLKTDLSPNAALDSQGRLTFAFGGRLIVTAGTAGDFRGRIAISADYR